MTATRAALLSLLFPFALSSLPASAQTSFRQAAEAAPALEFFLPQPVLTPVRQDRLSREAALEKRRLFDYRKSAVLSVKSDRPKVHRDYSEQTFRLRIQDPLGEKGEYVQEYFYYRTAEPGPRPTVVVFRPFGGGKTIDAMTAIKYAKRGYNAIISVPTESLADQTRPIAKIGSLLIRECIAGRVAIDLLETLPGTDKERIYATGISMGGIRTSLFFGVEPRVKKASEIVGGGDLPGIIADTEFTTLKKVRDARMRIEGIRTIEEFRSYMRKVTPVDPLDFGVLREPEDLLMFIGKGDQFVLDKYQEKLFHAFSRPEEGRYPLALHTEKGHILTAAKIEEHVIASIEFFETGVISANRDGR